LAFTSVVAFVLCAYACGSGDTSGITPITGIVVRADDLVAGHGCGTGPDQVYKYSVVVSTVPEVGQDPAFIAGGTFDCFADATFVNLCASTNGSLTFNVEVYAFTQAQYAGVGATPGELADDPSYCSLDGGPVPLDVDACTARNALRAEASFAASCTATQQSNIEVVAVCSPLVVPSPAAAPCGADSGT
jgi:hypothetical protein